MTETRHLKSKICLVGEKAVGKRSLIRRYVLNMFDEQYVTTIGTRVSKKEARVFLPERDMLVDVDMQIWDIMGEKGFRELLKEAYFYGANGIVAVADLTRRKTLDDLDDWIDGVEQIVGKVPLLIAVNKSDLVSGAVFGEKDIEQVAKAYDCPYVFTSAKSGEHVEDAFRKIGQMVTEAQLGRALGITGPNAVDAIIETLTAYQLPTSPPGQTDAGRLLEIMRHDKKVRDASVRFALLESVGKMRRDPTGAWTTSVEEKVVRSVLETPER